MDIKVLERLEKLNQLKLTDTEREELLSFFAQAEKDRAILDTVDTENVERMVYVMPLTNVLREDIAKKLYTREQLQQQAPEAMDGYWQVPQVME